MKSFSADLESLAGLNTGRQRRKIATAG